MLRLELKREVEEFSNAGRGWLSVNSGGTMISLALSPRASPFGDDEGKEVELILLMVLVGDRKSVV